VHRSIAALVCGIVFLFPQIGSCQPAAGDATGKEKPAASGIDALEVVKVGQIPKLLRWLSCDFDSKNPKETTVHIPAVNTWSVRQHWLKIGESIPGTRFRVKSFKRIEVPGEDGTHKDVSELTVTNVDTGAETVLPRRKVLDLGAEPYAEFHYKWRKRGKRPTEDFTGRVGETFTLPPEAKKEYKVIEIKEDSVVIELPDGRKKTLTAPPPR
jgi:hypothetical protein